MRRFHIAVYEMRFKELILEYAASTKQTSLEIAACPAFSAFLRLVRSPFLCRINPSHVAIGALCVQISLCF
jgi:hypothetical protein